MIASETPIPNDRDTLFSSGMTGEVPVGPEEESGAGTAAPPAGDPPGWIRYMPPLLRDLWERGLPLAFDSKTGEVAIDGFYRNGPMRTTINSDGTLTAIDRRGDKTRIATFDDLARLNFLWWRQAIKSHPDHHIAPKRPWIDFFIAHKLVRRVTMLVPVDETG